MRKVPAVLAGAAICAAAYAPAAQASPATLHKAVSVRAWRHKLTEPGTLGLTVRTRMCVKNVQAFANTDANTQTVSSAVTPPRLRGKVFTVKLRFTRNDLTGWWSVDLATARTCGGTRFSYVIWNGNIQVDVHPAAR